MTQSISSSLHKRPDSAQPSFEQPKDAPQRPKPAALIVFLENVGHIVGLDLPQWAMNTIDFVTEEYAKGLLHLYGAHRRYDRVVILEDALATGHRLSSALLTLSPTHRVDLLLLAHGNQGCLVGHRGKEMVGPETFRALHAVRVRDPQALDIRMVYGLNCHGVTLASTWIDLGADVANGAVGVNWFPEPSLSVFLRQWLSGASYSTAVTRSNRSANRVWSRILRSTHTRAHPWILSSRQIVFGRADLTISG